MTDRPGGGTEGPAGPDRGAYRPGADGGHADDAPDGDLTDPAHRLARWLMVLAPLLLGILVFLLLRLSAE